MSTSRRAKLGTALALTAVIGGMVGLTAAAVPLYRLFCQVTGFGGTTQRAEQAPDASVAETIKVRFNADVASDLPWRFSPAQREVEIRIGERQLAFYRAENQSDRPLLGSATFNVTPHKAALYFTKIDCFCFEEQQLQPHETVEMPVSFYVDPAILDDPNTRDVGAITLSYTFFLLEQPSEDVVETDGDLRPAS
jgi:cytochrome c oxidase assembly protein subunit 11